MDSGRSEPVGISCNITLESISGLTDHEFCSSPHPSSLSNPFTNENESIKKKKKHYSPQEDGDEQTREIPGEIICSELLRGL